MQGALVVGRCSLHLHAQAECKGLHHEDLISQKIVHSISKNVKKVFGIEQVTIPQCDAELEMYVL